MYSSIYGNDTPAFINQLAHTPALARLCDVGMHCGVEYAHFPLYQNQRMPYSRLTHSIGAAMIVWRFTRDAKQTMAALLHDIATPVFAHTIDFLNGDYVRQESTEWRTRAIIEGSAEVVRVLREWGVSTDEVADYHLYPIADNDTPMLSADRLEYTLGNAYCVYHMQADALRDIFNDLTVAPNELGADELCFQTLDTATRFTDIALRNAYFFVSDEDRYAMQRLADLMRRAVEVGVLARDDFYLTETEVIAKLSTHIRLSAMWREYAAVSAVASSREKPDDRYSINIPAKRRYIDPLVLMCGQPVRLSDIDGGVNDRIRALMELDFDRWVYAV